MAKKVRFSLEMDNGVEVRSLEELINNFSISKVLGYLSDGRLVTWLKDRYEDDLAMAIENIDINSDDLVREICEIFGVSYDENAKERERKLELLRNYPESMEYAQRIDCIAFDQDDIYDLLDNEVEEIYLCGNRFSIPVSKPNTKYIGIIEGVVVVIPSKKIIDFDARSIEFVNCRFDEEYGQLLQSEGQVSGEENVKKMYAGLEIDADELHDFVTNMMEAFEEYKSAVDEKDEDELYEYDDSIVCDDDDYNGYGFISKAKAKAACKTELSNAIDEIKEHYENAKKELIEITRDYYECMEDDLREFLSNVLFESYSTLIDVYCTGNTKKYLEDKLSELRCFVKESIVNWNSDIRKKQKVAFNQIVKNHFDKAENNVIEFKELFEMCKYEEVDDDDYEFYIDDASYVLINQYADIILAEEDSLPQSVNKAYGEINMEYLNLLIDWIRALQM